MSSQKSEKSSGNNKSSKRKPVLGFNHRYFEGYEAYKVPNGKNKKAKIVQIYTKEYYRVDLSDKQRLAYKVIYPLLALVVLSIFLYCATRNLTGNRELFVAIPEALSLFALIWMLITIIEYITRKTDMTIYTYQTTSINLKRVSLFSAVLLGVNALAMFIFVLFHRGDEPLMHSLCALGFIAGGVITYMLNRHESKTNYIRTPNKEKIPDGAEKLNNKKEEQKDKK